MRDRDNSPSGANNLNNGTNSYRSDSPELDSPRESRDRDRERDRYQSSSYIQKMKDRDRDYKKDKYTGIILLHPTLTFAKTICQENPFCLLLASLLQTNVIDAIEQIVPIMTELTRTEGQPNCVISRTSDLVPMTEIGIEAVEVELEEVVVVVVAVEEEEAMNGNAIENEGIVNAKEIG